MVWGGGSPLPGGFLHCAKTLDTREFKLFYFLNLPMGHCLHYLLLIYHLLCHLDNTFIEQRSSKIDMKYEISVSKLTSSPNFNLISLKIKGGQKMDFDTGKMT